MIQGANCASSLKVITAASLKQAYESRSLTAKRSFLTRTIDGAGSPA